jgi:hypothetical protein
VIHRKFGYVCEITTYQRYCIVGEDCDENGNRLKKKRYVLETELGLLGKVRLDLPNLA